MPRLALTYRGVFMRGRRDVGFADSSPLAVVSFQSDRSLTTPKKQKRPEWGYATTTIEAWRGARCKEVLTWLRGVTVIPSVGQKGSEEDSTLSKSLEKQGFKVL